MQPTVDPRLLAALGDESRADELLEVVLRFDVRPQLSANTAVPLMERRQNRASTVSSAIERALERAVKTTGIKPVDVTPFPLTCSAYVKASKQYFRALLKQDDVAAAVLNSA